MQGSFQLYLVMVSSSLWLSQAVHVYLLVVKEIRSAFNFVAYFIMGSLGVPVVLMVVAFSRNYVGYNGGYSFCFWNTEPPDAFKW